MVHPTVEQLKSDAFTLSKILATYKVKLSSQQCLDVLSRLRWNRPYEAVLAAVLAAMPASTNGARNSAGSERQTLREWLACAASFCDLVKTLDREGVNGAAYVGHKIPDGLHWDGATYLRAAGVAAERFSRTADAFIQEHASGPFQGLTFSVAAGDAIAWTQLATLRIQSLAKVGAKQPTRAQFIPIDMKQRRSEPLLFGAEARIELITLMPDYGDSSEPYQLVPRVELTYEVAGQQALKVFASVLQESVVQDIWAAAGGFDVETRILLTRNNTQDSLDEDWATDGDPDGKRLLKFCRKAARLSHEETCDWPPYFRLSRRLDATSTEEDLERYFMAICAHTVCIDGESGGWDEILGSQ